ncbi:hypothetical protein LshimejAT787_2200840 [Lyophyllum shimeji]|uniref:Tc1-like transposase DDE domain-containing protein n=1 Tax=Lyophyllum shimeji TaxID=47721 RepID=A0A9P3Q2E1_LYOSH|nr:hypothetical protein LshimejAT787_2200840 [Lyophyllum shimeji]
MRQCIVRWRNIEGRSVAEVAALADCSERTVYNILAFHRDFNVVDNPFARHRGGARILDAGDVNYLASLIDARPKIYLDELQEELAINRGVHVSISTVSRTLRRIAITNKQVSSTASERNEQLRAIWQAEYGGIPSDYFVWLDEASVDDFTNQRQNGWATVGRACVCRDTFIRGQRYSILPALSYEGIIALDIVEGSVNKEKFIQFIRNDLAPQLNPYPNPRSVVVMDNCAIHHDEEIRAIIEDECQAKLIYLPPYSPDFNPIEQAFHSIKAWLRRHEAEAIGPEVRPWLIHQARMAITAEMAEEWIKNCGY